MKYFDKIDQYLKGQLSEAEEKAFLQEVAENKELASELELQEAEETVLEVFSKDELLNEIKMIYEEEQQHQKDKKDVPFRSRKFFLLGIAIAITILVAAILIINELIKKTSQPAPPSPQAFAQTLYEDTHPPKFDNQTKSIDNQDADAFYEQVARIPEAGNEELSAIIDYIGTVRDQYPEAIYYLAHARFRQEEYELAANLFQAFLDQDVGFKSDAEFYRVLALVLSDQKEIAKQEITTLLDRDYNHAYENSLKELQQSLE